MSEQRALPVDTLGSWPPKWLLWLVSGLALLAIVANFAFTVSSGSSAKTARALAERQDCAREINDDLVALRDRVAAESRDEARAFNAIVVYAFRLPQGSPVDDTLTMLVDQYEAAGVRVHEAERALEKRPPTSELVVEQCPEV